MNFCKPSVESMEKLPCHFLVVTSNTQVINEAKPARNASYLNNS
jgi:hypothetical protein